MGPVGVGKSTHIGLLRDYLKLKNIRVVTTFIKSSHLLAYILMRFLTASDSYQKDLCPGAEGLTGVSPRKEVIRKLFPVWSFLDSLSITVKFFFTVYLPSCLGFTVLIEEGPIMTLFTYWASFPRFFDTKPKVLSFISNLLGYILSKKHINIVLDASVEELDKRRAQRSYRRKELAEYIAMQKDWVKRLNLGNMIFVDTTDKSIARVHKNVLAALESICIRAPMRVR